MLTTPPRSASDGHLLVERRRRQVDLQAGLGAHAVIREDHDAAAGRPHEVGGRGRDLQPAQRNRACRLSRRYHALQLDAFASVGVERAS